MVTNNNESTNPINSDANPNTPTPEPTMSEESIKKLEQRIAQREAEHAAAAAKSRLSSTFITLKDGKL
jgi:hypothetical protein